MNISRRFLPAITFVFILSTICYSQGIASDFGQVLGTLRKNATQTHRSLYYYDIKDGVNGFVAKHRGSAAIEYLERKAGEPNSRKLALICLAGLVATGKPAEDVLYRQIYGQDAAIQRDALIAIGCIDSEYGRPIAETVAIRPAPWSVRKAAIEMLVVISREMHLPR